MSILSILCLLPARSHNGSLTHILSTSHDVGLCIGFLQLRQGKRKKAINRRAKAYETWAKILRVAQMTHGMSNFVARVRVGDTRDSWVSPLARSSGVSKPTKK